MGSFLARPRHPGCGPARKKPGWGGPATTPHETQEMKLRLPGASPRETAQFKDGAGFTGVNPNVSAPGSAVAPAVAPAVRGRAGGAGPDLWAAHGLAPCRAN